LLAGLAAAGVFIMVSLFFPLRYRAESELFLTYKTDFENQTKIFEQAGKTLAEAVKSDDFYSKVANQPGLDFDKTYFENVSDKIKRERWGDSLSVHLGKTGIIKVRAYSSAKNVRPMLLAINSALMTQGWEYAGADAQIKLLNNPIVSKFPVKPNVFLNAMIGFILGVLIASLALILKRVKISNF